MFLSHLGTIGASAYLHIITCCRMQHGDENQGVPVSRLPLICVQAKGFSPICHLVNDLGIVCN